MAVVNWCLALVVVVLAFAVPIFLNTEHASIYSSVLNVINNNVNDKRSSVVEEFDSQWDPSKGAEERVGKIQSLVNHYYDIVTDFYEYGWGQSFHFAPRFKGEAFDASLARHEYRLAHRVGLKAGLKALDVGCGVGGPARNIARFSGAKVTGLNNNLYQIGRGNAAGKKEHVDGLVDYIHGDFMNIPAPNNTYDAVYAIEATCHAPVKEGVYGEIFRVLKPGGYFGAYEWTVTDAYDPNNEEHKRIKLGIEHGDALPDLPHYSVVDKAIKAVGFELVESRDEVLEAVKENGDFNVEWYNPLEGHLTLTGFKHTPLGRYMTAIMVYVLETINLAPKGSYATAMMLEDGASNLVKGGRLRLFTPMYYVLGRKPLETPEAPKAAAVPAPKKDAKKAVPLP